VGGTVGCAVGFAVGSNDGTMGSMVGVRAMLGTRAALVGGEVEDVTTVGGEMEGEAIVAY
jgi:hypothetical protein